MKQNYHSGSVPSRTATGQRSAVRTANPLKQLLLMTLLLFTFIGGARAQETLTVYEGTVTNNVVPAYIYYFDDFTRSQFVIPADDLAEMNGGTISSLKFYTTNNNVPYTTVSSARVYLMEVDYTAMTGLEPTANGTIVYEGYFDVVTEGEGGSLTITLATPYTYGGGNLLIGIENTEDNDYKSIYFYGQEVTNAAWAGSNGSSLEGVTGGVRNFIPKTTFTYEPGSFGACAKPSALTANGAPTPFDFSFNIEGGSGSYNIELKAGDADWAPYEEEVVGPTVNLTGLIPETAYQVRVQSICEETNPETGDNLLSGWKTLSFTTPVACPAPTDMVISDITAYSANVGWTSDNENIELRYTPYVPGTDFDDSQMNGWTTIDADGDGYTWVLATEASGIYHNTGVDLTGQGHNGSTDFIVSGSYTNAGGGALTPDNYLVSPQITLGGSISFWAQAQDTDYPAEHFGVAVSTTGNTDAADFTTIQEWTLTAKRAAMPGVFRSNAPRGINKLRAGSWYQYTVDLSAYSGQGYVAIRHFNCTDQFILNVDDIVIVQPDSEIPWVYVDNPANPQALTNLEPETTYTVQVRGNCDDEGYSKWLEGSFTTLPTCMVPTNLVVSNVDKRSADLAWTPNGEEDAWQICINGDEENLIEVSETTYSFTDLEPLTNYTVKVRAKCSEENQSTWSSTVTFTTLIACPAPTGLAVADIANVSAVASWVSDGDVELQYAENVWKQYDNGVYATTMGAGGTLYWGIMLPAASLTASEPLTKVALHTTYSGEATLNVYLGGDQPTGTPAATQTFTMLGDGDFMEIALDNPVGIDGTQNLWITFYQSGLSYSADGCTGPTDPNGRWVSLDGETWSDIAGYGYDYTWMIRAGFGDTDTEWVTVDNATSPQAITDLTPETSYFVRVKHICGGIDGESDWVTTNFTTDVPCSTPTALTATPYALSAKLSWEGVSDSYTVRYGYDEVDEAIFTEDFAGEIPADWTNTSEYPWTVVDGYIQSGNAGVGSSTSTISFTINVSTDANFEFDAKCMGEGTSTVWDKCIFSIDGTAMFTKGANGDQWDHYSFPVTAGEHTFTWSYSKDSSVNPSGDYMAVDNIAIVTLNTTWNTVNTNANECVLTGLTPLTSYHVQVMGHCGDEYGTSEWSEMISFTTTDNACPMPTNLVADNITATTADLSWNGSPDVESFTVRYRVPEHVVGGLSETFDNTSIPAGWTRYQGLVDDVIAGTATLSSTTNGWNFGNTHVFGEYHARINIWGTPVKYWLVTPEVTPASGTLSFDLALTDYNNADPIEDPTDQADDRFVVLVYANDAWTILREWNNSGSDYVYNTIATEGEAVSIDLSAYVGQTVKIAFYGESTVGNGDNDLHIDNVVIGAAETIPATDWQTVTVTETNVTLTGLTPGTSYEVQVKSDCSDPEEWSAATTFTTEPVVEIALANDATNNEELIADNDGNFANVTLSGRTLYKDGCWNTICLPFNVDLTIAGSPLDGAHAKTISDDKNSTTLSGTHVTLTFGEEVETLVAGTPYIIKWNKAEGYDEADPTTRDIFEPVFSNVKINKQKKNVEIEGIVNFVGNYNAKVLDPSANADDTYIYYMAGDNALKHIVEGSTRTLGACRAYFDFSPALNTGAAREIILNFGDGEGATTAIEDGIVANENETGWYTVDGKKLDKQPARKGVYIHNGRKVVIK